MWILAAEAGMAGSTIEIERLSRPLCPVLPVGLVEMLGTTEEPVMQLSLCICCRLSLLAITTTGGRGSVSLSGGSMACAAHFCILQLEEECHENHSLYTYSSEVK